MDLNNIMRARPHLHLDGSHPSHVSFTAQSLCMHMCGNSFPLGTNLTIPGYLSHEALLVCEETLSSKLGNNESDVNLNVCNFDWVLTHWFPTRKSSHVGAGRVTGQ